MGAGENRKRESTMKMRIKRLSLAATLVMSVIGVFAGKMEDCGGFKARNYRQGTDGKLYTSAGTEVKDFQKGISEAERNEYIIAAKMAASGYLDDRYDDYKSDFYKDGIDTGYEEVDRNTLESIILAAHNANTKSELHIKKETIVFKSEENKAEHCGEDVALLTITGSGDSRLNARVFINKDGSIGIVFGGTASGSDVIDDLLNVSHLTPTPKPYKEAAELLRAVKAVFPETNINLYGHSEGGGEAMYAVLSEGIKNGEGGKVKYYGVNSAGLNGLKTNNIISKDLTPKDIEENFVLIQNKDEKLPGKIPVSAVAYQFGTVVLVPDMGAVFTKENDAEYFSRAKNKAFPNLDGAHGIEETLWKMTHCSLAVCGKKDDDNDREANDTRDDDFSPFDIEPEINGNGQMCPVPGNGSTGGGSSGGQRTSQPTTRRRGGSGGGDTSSRIW